MRRASAGSPHRCPHIETIVRALRDKNSLFGSRHFRSPRGFIPEGSLFMSLRATGYPERPPVVGRSGLRLEGLMPRSFTLLFPRCLSINLSVFSLAPFHSAKNWGIKINTFQLLSNCFAMCFYLPILTVPLPYLCASGVLART